MIAPISKLGRRAWLGQLSALAVVSGCQPFEPVTNLELRDFDDEAAAMRWMREEEKLARDLYLTLGERFPGVHQFANIAQSEQHHMDAMRGLLAAAGEADPIVDDKVGVFQEPELAQLYQALLVAGESSEIDALRVGAEVEELDIADLDNAIAGTDDPQAHSVYTHLRQGSCNHLRAFVRGLQKRGHEYAPQHLDREVFDAALAQAHGGHGRGHGHGHGHGAR